MSIGEHQTKLTVRLLVTTTAYKNKDNQFSEIKTIDK